VDGVPLITAAELKGRLDRGEPILPLDVRQPTAYAKQPGGIPGSLRIPPAAVPDFYGKLPRDRLVVPYCT
jgi:rhodanese-related sulfurtransferase